MVVGDYIVKIEPPSVIPGKIIDQDGNLFVVQWKETAFGVIPADSIDYQVIGHGDPKTGWANKGK